MLRLRSDRTRLFFSKSTSARLLLFFPIGHKRSRTPENVPPYNSSLKEHHDYIQTANTGPSLLLLLLLLFIRFVCRVCVEVPGAADIVYGFPVYLCGVAASPRGHNNNNRSMYRSPSRPSLPWSSKSYAFLRRGGQQKCYIYTYIYLSYK